ncbi:hypothetical protein HZB07_07045 [Candidatus Saganbacteria bacterium]|nr:hypothetical protein [Candidatus Saganbacteria bacterium]
MGIPGITFILPDWRKVSLPKRTGITPQDKQALEKIVRGVFRPQAGFYCGIEGIDINITRHGANISMNVLYSPGRHDILYAAIRQASNKLEDETPLRELIVKIDPLPEIYRTRHHGAYEGNRITFQIQYSLVPVE